MVPRASSPASPLLGRLTAALGGLLSGARSTAAGQRHGAVPAFATHLTGATTPHVAAAVPMATPHLRAAGEHGHEPRREEDDLDPLTRHAAQLAPPSLMIPPLPQVTHTADPGGAPALRAMTSLEEILPQLVRRLSMSGDGKRGAIRVEIDSGALAGSTLLVSAEEGRLRVELSAPAGVDAASWRDRIATRLAARGLVVDEISVNNA